MLLALALCLSAADVDGGIEPTPSFTADSATNSPVGIAPQQTHSPPAPSSSLTSPKVSGGYGKGISLEAGNLELNVRGRVQVLGTAIVPDSGSTTPRSNSFAIRRARLLFRTKLPFDLSGTLQLAFARQDMELDEPNVLRDYYIEWRRFRDVSIRFGQFKVPFDVQRVVSSSSLQFADRSVVTQELNMERDIGVAAFSEDALGLGHRLRYTLAVMGGEGRNRFGNNIGLLYIARASVAPLGKIDDRVEGDPDRERRFRFAIGGAVARNNATRRNRSTAGETYKLGTFNYTHATVDFHAKAYGFSLLAQGFLRDADTDSIVDATGKITEWSRSGWGWFAQGGAYVNDWLEVVARYGEMRPFQGTDPGFHRQREVGGGLNWMISKHDLKLQLDYFWLDDGTFKAGRHQVRLQAQVYF